MLKLLLALIAVSISLAIPVEPEQPVSPAIPVESERPVYLASPVERDQPVSLSTLVAPDQPVDETLKPEKELLPPVHPNSPTSDLKTDSSLWWGYQPYYYTYHRPRYYSYYTPYYYNQWGKYYTYW